MRLGVALTSGFTRAHLDEFCSALAGATGLNVEGVGVWYYHRLLEALDIGGVDIAWLPPILAAQAMIRGVAAPIALPMRGGVTSYSTALFVREESRIQKPSDLHGARAAWVDRQSASGYLLIRAHLRTIGIDLDHAVGSDRMLGSHEEVVHAVLEGSADVGASYVHLDPLDERPIRAAWGAARVRVITHAGPIPADVVAASNRLDVGVTDRVQRALFHGQRARLRDVARMLLGADAFVAPRPGHLDAVAALLPRLDEGVLPRTVSWPRG